ncbi:MAG: TonB-dependent receptor, partial [Flavobacteriales bacterium]
MQGQILECETGQPVAFATVVAINTRIGGVTDEFGKFTLMIPDSTLYLEFRFIGRSMKKVERTNTGWCNLSLNICLNEESSSPLPDPDFMYPIEPEVTVEGFRTHRPKHQTPASIAVVDRKTLDATDQTSLLNAVNTVPGVMMEQRGNGGSHRISIRGSSLRAPFAVRNVKMYFEGIPLTSPDGQTPLEMMDAFDIGRLEIIKGPAGSVYGSGNGGVLQFFSKNVHLEQTQVSTGAMLGNYGMSRATTEITTPFENGGLRASYIFQDNRGFRTQEYNHKNQVSLYAVKFYKRNTFKFYTTYLNANWALPGGLNAAEADTLPTQANTFSWKNNAHVWRERLMAGAVHQYRFKMPSGREMNLNSSVYYYQTNKKNPYGTSAFNSGYKDEIATGPGGRLDVNYFDFSHEIRFKVNAGGEFQHERYNILESNLVSGQPGVYKYLYDVRYNTLMGYVSGDADWDQRIILEAGTSINQTNQLIQGKNHFGFDFNTAATWQTQLLPRIALSVQLYHQCYAFASLSYGNSNPTIFEMVDQATNTYNLQLKPETGRNVEAGIKGRDNSKTIYFELAAYDFALNNFIFQRTENIPLADTVLQVEKYVNAGSAKQQGIEAALQKSLKLNEEGDMVEWWGALSIFNYKFGIYTNDDGDFSGKKLT